MRATSTSRSRYHLTNMQHSSFQTESPGHYTADQKTLCCKEAAEFKSRIQSELCPSGDQAAALSSYKTACEEAGYGCMLSSSSAICSLESQLIRGPSKRAPTQRRPQHRYPHPRPHPHQAQHYYQAPPIAQLLTQFYTHLRPPILIRNVHAQRPQLSCKMPD